MKSIIVQFSLLRSRWHKTNVIFLNELLSLYMCRRNTPCQANFEKISIATVYWGNAFGTSKSGHSLAATCNIEHKELLTYNRSADRRTAGWLCRLDTGGGNDGAASSRASIILQKWREKKVTVCVFSLRLENLQFYSNSTKSINQIFICPDIWMHWAGPSRGACT